jgi:hypothetical protein
MLRKAKVYALDRLLPERFGGKVGRDLALEVSRRRERADTRHPFFGPLLTVFSKDSQVSENRSERGHNARCRLVFAVERREHKAEVPPGEVVEAEMDRSCASPRSPRKEGSGFHR